MDTLIDKISLTLKNLRQDRGWSLDTTSQKTGVSKAMLGQIERGESSPTISTLWKIASGFDVSFSSFVEDTQTSTTKTIIHKGTLQQIHPSDDKLLVMPIIAYDEKLHFEVFMLQLLPGCMHLSPAHQKGVVEQIIVTQGEMEIFADSKWHKVGLNQGFTFDASEPHGYRNLSPNKATILDMIHYNKI